MNVVFQRRHELGAVHHGPFAQQFRKRRREEILAEIIGGYVGKEFSVEHSGCNIRFVQTLSDLL